MLFEFEYQDGGRNKYFKAKKVGDCVTRAICNATGKDYKEVYDRLRYLEKTMPLKSNEIRGSVRQGVRKSVYKHYIENELGCMWVSTSYIGQGTKYHLDDDDLPSNKILIVRLSGHLTCVKYGKILDTYDPSRKGTRMVYGYWVVK